MRAGFCARGALWENFFRARGMQLFKPVARGVRALTHEAV